MSTNKLEYLNDSLHTYIKVTHGDGCHIRCCEDPPKVWGAEQSMSARMDISTQEGRKTQFRGSVHFLKGEGEGYQKGGIKHKGEPVISLGFEEK